MVGMFLMWNKKKEDRNSDCRSVGVATVLLQKQNLRSLVKYLCKVVENNNSGTCSL